MHFQITRLPDYLDVELTGQVELEPLLALLRKLGKATQANGDTRILFDLLRLDGEMHFTGQMQTGEEVAQSFSHMARVASVVARDRITHTSEKVARARGAQLKVFDSKDAAITWLRDYGPGEAGLSDASAPPLDPVRAALWTAVQHLFPTHAQAIQLANGTLAISWPVQGQGTATLAMAAPITIRLEPELEECMRRVDDAQRARIAAHQESAFKAGLVGYDPFTALPRARVIILG